MFLNIIKYWLLIFSQKKRMMAYIVYDWESIWISPHKSLWTFNIYWSIILLSKSLEPTCNKLVSAFLDSTIGKNNNVKLKKIIVSGKKEPSRFTRSWTILLGLLLLCVFFAVEKLDVYFIFIITISGSPFFCLLTRNFKK